MYTFVVTWYTETGCKTMEFADFWNADNYAASRSVHYETATLTCKELRSIYHEYQNGNRTR